MNTAERQDREARNGAPSNPRLRGREQILERRRVARRRRHLARVDVGLGLLGAMILILAAPGLAITGLIALIVLVGCLAAFVIERRRSARARERVAPPDG